MKSESPLSNYNYKKYILIAVLSLVLLIQAGQSVTQTSFAGLCAQCMGSGYQYCSSTCQSYGDTCGTTASTNLYNTCNSQQKTAAPCLTTVNIGGYQTASNRTYFDTTLSAGQWMEYQLQTHQMRKSSGTSTLIRLQKSGTKSTPTAPSQATQTPRSMIQPIIRMYKLVLLSTFPWQAATQLVFVNSAAVTATASINMYGFSAGREVLYCSGAIFGFTLFLLYLAFAYMY